jgi:Domain of unknown function (DUF4166)
MKPSPAITRTAISTDESLIDLRFRALVTDDDWAELPVPIRRRFSRRLADGNTAVYVGEILETRTNTAGWLLAHAARLIGSPFPVSRDTHVPSVVCVTEDMANGGQIWTRLYARRRRFPQIVHSSKRFAGPTGLEEHVGHGVGMTLTMEVKDDALVFRSRDYFVELFGLRIRLPAWLTPGALSVTHAECADGRFSFTLDVVHPRFGLMMRQMGLFREARA